MIANLFQGFSKIVNLLKNYGESCQYERCQYGGCRYGSFQHGSFAGLCEIGRGGFNGMLGKLPEKLHGAIDLLHQRVKHFRRQGLSAVAERFFRIVVDFDDQAVGSGRNGG